MPDDLSLGELGRIIQGLRVDVRDDMAQINQRLDRLVSLDVYTVEKASLVKELADLARVVEQLSKKHDDDIKSVRDQREKDADRVTQTRRWMVGMVVSMLSLIVPVIIFVVGGKS